MTQTAHFQQLLQAAAAQPEPQRLLFVFAAAELPAEATPAQRQRFHAGQGGALAPLMCVDKAPEDLAGFAALLAESRQAGPPWQVVFAASLSGSDGRPQTDAALESMVGAVRGGGVGRFAAYGPTGEPLQFS
jgi:hypothetical protein